MIPALDPQAVLDPQYRDYLGALKGAGFRGEVETRYGHRLSLATDNSVYQMLPQGLLFPLDADDIQLALRLAQNPEFQSLTFSARGGGTGTNGQSLNRGIIIDTSRHMRAVTSVDAEARQAVVQCGVIKDQLNDVLRPHGLFFSPDLSTSNRATLGGMINTDASGAGSLVYGKTSDHVLALRAILDDGSELITGPWDAQARAKLTGRARELAETVLALCKEKQGLIEARFPKLNRFLTGYDLKHAYDPDTDILDLTRLLCGSEGTLAFVVEATLDLDPIPDTRVLVNIQYDSFDSALRHAPELVAAQATVVETIDATVLNLAREDVIWHTVAALVEPEGADDAGRFDGINMVEFAGEGEAVEQKLVALLARLDSGDNAAVLGYKLCRDGGSIGRVYAMRKKAVGLLANAKGPRKPLAFVEDTAVPPEKLADFIAEFRALLDAEGLQYGMFGHVDAGVLHVRPALDLCDPADERQLKQLSDKVAELTRQYGGLMWGEHGRGVRSEYGPAVFGELFDDLRRIKGWFDPDNRLNPGKICTPLESEAVLYPVESPTRGAFNRRISPKSRDEYERAIRCNGNGLCFNYQVDSPMCPSYKASGDRVESPKGRAELYRAWLRLLAREGVDLAQYPPRPAPLWQRVRNQFAKEVDFSHEVHAGMLSCLACKACSGACPVKVDIPTLRAEFLHHYYGRYLRPLKDHFVANLEDSLPLQARFPKLVNALSQNGLSRYLLRHLVGYVDAPALTVPTLAERVGTKQPTTLAQLERTLERASSEQRANMVLLVQDPFNSHYDAALVEKGLALLARLGFEPLLVPYLPNGKPQHIKGFLDRFRRTALKTSAALTRLARFKVPMVGLDPALVMTYSDEYVTILKEERGDFEVEVLQQFLARHLDRWPQRSDSHRAFRLMGHCTENSVRPAGGVEWQRVLAHFGGELKLVSLGCCGMAGTYGHEVANLDRSRQLFDQSWAPELAREGGEPLSSGYSCRSQVKRFGLTALRHPLEVLLELVDGD
ncbi:FAD-binding and (Fe-S)-binding domain-containing protein [Ferrimonas balearica]|uniref:D-2-hydroxyglutarate dehydrogenase YdiJ n=1 Tax=Ferrimonas balearica TaxID=44012 RepID=UPI001C99A132|nr:FAD-binding and (Fe-S)-binding domain-containing protein [Ferrimonas balearica]MBY5991876.1 FAD-binding oxidoreductase [Ferrimonas balearica]